jgi:hypothetical protein
MPSGLYSSISKTPKYAKCLACVVNAQDEHIKLEDVKAEQSFKDQSREEKSRRSSHTNRTYKAKESITGEEGTRSEQEQSRY